MKQREKRLALVVGAVVLVFPVVLGVRGFLVTPLKEIDSQTQGLRDKLQQINDERRAFIANDDFIKSVNRCTFGRDTDVATAQAGKMLTDQINRLGLREEQFIRMPLAPHRFKGAQEIGWNVQGEGPLPKMIDLLFVLAQTPQVHRLENVVISAAERAGRVKAHFRYLSLVIDGASEGPKPDLQPRCTLNSPDRRFYDLIVQRDLLRPYIQRSAPPDADSTPASLDATNRPETLKIVSLSEWEGQPEVTICDQSTMNVTRLKPGETLAGGQIVVVDYRTLPMPGNPDLASNSRVILKIGSEYWAIEQGQTLADKRRLTPEQLPPQLPKL